MEQCIPQPVIEPDSVAGSTNETAFGISPLARGVLKVAVGIASDIGREVIEPELYQSHQRQQPTRNQEALLAALEVALAQSEMELLEAQRPGRIMQRFFDVPEQTNEDAQNLAGVRTELAEIANTQPKTITVEPRDYILQTSMGIKSAP